MTDTLQLLILSGCDEAGGYFIPYYSTDKGFWLNSLIKGSSWQEGLLSLFCNWKRLTLESALIIFEGALSFADHPQTHPMFRACPGGPFAERKGLPSLYVA